MQPTKPTHKRNIQLSKVLMAAVSSAIFFSILVSKLSMGGKDKFEPQKRASRPKTFTSSTLLKWSRTVTKTSSWYSSFSCRRSSSWARCFDNILFRSSFRTSFKTSCNCCAICASCVFLASANTRLSTFLLSISNAKRASLASLKENNFRFICVNYFLTHFKFITVDNLKFCRT